MQMQSCFEPLLMQPPVLNLALSPHVHPSPGPAPTGFPLPSSDQILPSALSYWDNVAVDHFTCQDEALYVHPLMRRPASVLSGKSLEMCTESLGSETGSGNFLEDAAEIYPFFATDQCCELPMLKSKKVNRDRSRDYPPPLRSMTGSAVMRMRPCRGDGRLVLQAVVASSCRNSFLVERGEGRLRLSLFLEDDTTYHDGQVERAGEGQEYQAEGEPEGEEEGEETGKGEEWIGAGPGRRPCRRCKEGEGLVYWKPCWVAT